VRVHGAGRVGAALAAQLAAAGVGRVEVVDGGRAGAEDAAPGGLLPEDAGLPREQAARQALRRAAPWRAAAPPVGPLPDLVVLAPRDRTAGFAPDPELSRGLVRSGRPHLYAGVLETTGVVGPFVLPGETPCGRCVSMRRAERDPAWPRLLAQLCSGSSGGSDRPGPPPACDGVLAAAVAALAALHALIHLDGGSPPSLGAVLEVSMTDGEVRRRPLTAHPECGCHWESAEALSAGGHGVTAVPPSGQMWRGEDNGADEPAVPVAAGGPRRTTLELEEA
jgi:bacteriocin biosynthesis cyclodehydratase domain-containing protein